MTDKFNTDKISIDVQTISFSKIYKKRILIGKITFYNILTIDE
jgi:hypothetical protein